MGFPGTAHRSGGVPAGRRARCQTNKNSPAYARRARCGRSCSPRRQHLPHPRNRRQPGDIAAVFGPRPARTAPSPAHHRADLHTTAGPKAPTRRQPTTARIARSPQQPESHRRSNAARLRPARHPASPQGPRARRPASPGAARASSGSAPGPRGRAHDRPYARTPSSGCAHTTSPPTIVAATSGIPAR